MGHMLRDFVPLEQRGDKDQERTDADDQKAHRSASIPQARSQH